MASFDALRHVTIGQYIPTGSLIHRLDSRAKLVATILFMMAVVVATGYLNNLVLCGVMVVLVLVSRLSIRYIASAIKPALPVILVLALLQLFFYSGSMAVQPVLAWGAIRIYPAAIRLLVVSLLRFVDLLFLTSLLTNTTTTGDLTHGLESLLRPLDRIGLPGHELAMIGAIAVRFVPVLGEQMESIMMAQSSRGLSRPGGRWSLLANTRRLARLVVPLFVDAYRRADEMMLAMQARCYRGGRGRTHLIRLTFGRRDYAAIGISLFIVVSILIMQRAALP